MSEDINIRPAKPGDEQLIFELIKGLAEYEKLAHEVTGSAEKLREDLFGERPFAEAMIAEYDGDSVGFALYFYNYSTFLTQPGIYLEDLFVLPEYRGKGIGEALLRKLGSIALDKGAGRLEWSVLDWNEPSIKFYKKMGADILTEWQTCRVTGDSLFKLAGSRT